MGSDRAQGGELAKSERGRGGAEVHPGHRSLSASPGWALVPVSAVSLPVGTTRFLSSDLSSPSSSQWDFLSLANRSALTRTVKLLCGAELGGIRSHFIFHF